MNDNKTIVGLYPRVSTEDQSRFGHSLDEQEDKDKILNYIEQVNDTNNDYKKMTKLSNTLNNVDEELKSAKSIKEENDALSIRNASLEKQIIVKDEEIDDLKKR